MFNKIKITLYNSVYMGTSGEKVRITDRIKQNVFNRFHILCKIIVMVMYIMLLSLMPVEETGQTRVSSFKFRCFSIHKKKKFQLEEEGNGIIFLWGFRSRCS